MPKNSKLSIFTLFSFFLLLPTSSAHPCMALVKRKLSTTIIINTHIFITHNITHVILNIARCETIDNQPFFIHFFHCMFIAMVVRFITRRFIGEYDTRECFYNFNTIIDNEMVSFEILDSCGINNQVNITFLSTSLFN